MAEVLSNWSFMAVLQSFVHDIRCYIPFSGGLLNRNLALILHYC